VSQRAFIILLILLAVLVALSAASFPGAMIGFLFGITVAFFIAIPGAAIGNAPCSSLPRPCRPGCGSGEATWTERDQRGCGWPFCWPCH
jgi:hypothetical protein